MEYLRSLTNTTKKGTNAFNLTSCAKELGFSTKVVEGNILLIEKEILPCIAHVIIDSKYMHFIVIHEICKKHIVVADPSSGIKKLSYDEFNKISTNKFIFLKPYKTIPIIKNEKEFLKLCINILKDYKNVFTSIIIFSFIYTLMNIATSYSFQFIIEESISILSKRNLIFIGAIVIFMTFFKNIMHYYRIKLFNFISIKIDMILMNNTIRHIISLPYQYYKSKTTGDILSRVTDLSNIKNNISNFFLYIFVDCFLALFVLFFLIKINLNMTILSCIILVLYIIIVKVFNAILEDKIMSSRQAVSQVNSTIVESLESVDTIKGLNVERIFKDRFKRIYEKYLKINHSFNNLYNVEDLIKNIIDGIGINIIIFIGASYVLKNKMTIGELITYNALIIYFFEPLKNVIDSTISIKEFKISIKRIIDIYSIKEEKLIVDNKYVEKLVKGDIVIRNLSYSYNGQNKILNGINMEIKESKKVLISGESGSGKSTLMKIIMKYYSVDNNVVEINNKDLNDYNLLEIRRDICYISQSEKLLTDTVYNNIVLDRKVDYDDFLKVAKLFRIDEIVKDNILKYNMLLEENGFNISGGERQKIILARGVLKKSNIYILDESFSQIDINSERIILKELFDILKDKTVIVISHRFNNNDLFDATYTVKEGYLYNGCVSV